MKVSTRIFFCYLTISIVCLYYPFDWILDNMRTRYLEGVEDPLVDQANILAAAVGIEMSNGSFDETLWYDTFAEVYQRSVSAQIYQLLKKSVDTRIYMTDRNGVVTFDSRFPENVGKDYAQWRDVHLTLSGKYGARTTRNVPDDENSSVLFVAAPIKVDGEIVGVLSVGKPTTNITWFVENAKVQVVAVALIALLVASLFSYLVSYWITRPIKRLTDYAIGMTDGSRPPFPELGKSEISQMGTAFKEMQEALEGKKYVEEYIQNLTHEIKSPLSAIRGAAELLDEPMEENQRKRFLNNIKNESLRIQDIIDRMLELAALENRQKLVKMEPVSLKGLVNTVVEGLESVMTRKSVSVSVALEDVTLTGDSFLLHRALVNLLQNSIDFSEEGGAISIQCRQEGSHLMIEIVDQGVGIEPYATQRIFEKFFSLQRPDSGKKSTGLGLNFVREVAHLHGGTITLQNRTPRGVRALLILALEPPLSP
ncbi:MAG: two-component system sensor histidine kinase CreC [Desulfobulbaceae bacterium]|nr:MAG: two-component system sensor histidine kinase CreC [Desulfobulbaceae bacterium]